MTARPPITTTAGYLLYKSGVLAQNGMDAALDAVDLSPRQFLILSFVALDELSQQDVARRLAIDPTLVGTIVDELEARRLVDRSRDPSDRRRYVLVLTAQGRRLLDKAEQRATVAQDELLAPLDPAEREVLAEMLRRVVQPRLPWLGDDES